MNKSEPLAFPSGPSQNATTKIEGKPLISTTHVRDNEQSSTNVKEKGADWALQLEDKRPVSQKNIPSPKANTGPTLGSQAHDNQLEGMSQASALSTSRRKEVDNECVQDFVKNAFEDASEKDIKDHETSVKK